MPNSDAGNALLGAGVFTTALLFAAVMYILLALPLYAIAKKVGHDLAWLAWVPIANAWLMLDLAGLSGWLLILAFIPIVNIVFWFIMVYAWMKIAERMGHPSWLGILTIVPILNILVPYYIAYAAPTQQRI